MNRTPLSLLITATVCGAFLISGARLNSQEVALKSPLDPLLALKASNAELLKKQEASLKKLEELKKQAEQLRIFTKRA